jgi:hypothetical protein
VDKDIYKVGIGSCAVEVLAPSPESAVMWYALQKNPVSQMGVHILSLIVVYEKNGVRQTGLAPFAARDLLEYSVDELSQIIKDAKTCEAAA